MPLPVIAEVARITLLWLPGEGISPRNVFHLRGALDDIPAFAAAIDTAFGTASVADNMFDPMDSGEFCPSFDLLPLDGSTATSTWGITEALHGAGAGETVLAACAVASLKSDVRGPRGRGRMYIGPVRESAIDGGVLNATRVANVAAGFANFSAALLAGTPAIEFGVASYVHSDFNVYTSFSCDTILGTQRRRNDQLR